MLRNINSKNSFTYIDMHQQFAFITFMIFTLKNKIKRIEKKYDQTTRTYDVYWKNKHN
jgi:hypothetical protein